VRTLPAPPNVPPPLSIAPVPYTPDWLTGLPAPSRSCTTGCWANVTPLCAVAEGWVVSVSCVAAPAPTVIVVGTAPVRPLAEKPSVRSPAAPVMERLVKLASPLPFVDAIAEPPDLHALTPRRAFDLTPDSLTGLPAPSRSCTTGC